MADIYVQLAEKIVREHQQKNKSAAVLPDRIELCGFEGDYDAFISWKKSLDFAKEKTGIPKDAKFIFDKIVRYPVESKTPLEAMQFIHELKNSITLLGIENGPIYSS